MSYEQASHLSSTWGLVLLAVCFAVATAYALWPGNKDKFSRAAQTPLNDGDDHG